MFRDAAELLADVSGGTDIHTTALLYGGGGALTNSAGAVDKLGSNSAMPTLEGEDA